MLEFNALALLTCLSRNSFLIYNTKVLNSDVRRYSLNLNCSKNPPNQRNQCSINVFSQEVNLVLYSLVSLGRGVSLPSV